MKYVNYDQTTTNDEVQYKSEKREVICDEI